MADLSTNIQNLKDAVAEFEAQYTKYAENGVNSAGSRSRKALMVAKKEINALRKTILDEQKDKKAARKAEKADKPAGKKGKKGKKADAEASEE